MGGAPPPRRASPAHLAPTSTAPQACYTNLRDLLKSVVSPNDGDSPVPLAEVKRVADFVNIKVCRGVFAAAKPNDAFEAFRKHMRLFRPLILSPATSRLPDPNGTIAAAAGLVHWGWLCKQCATRRP